MCSTAGLQQVPLFQFLLKLTRQGQDESSGQADLIAELEASLDDSDQVDGDAVDGDDELGEQEVDQDVVERGPGLEIVFVDPSAIKIVSFFTKLGLDTSG